jgi:uncharacterized protein involved in exopolysaccharide biosynthesis
MHRYLETFFRHPKLYLLPIVLTLFVSVSIAALQPPKYESTARLWFDSSPSNSATLNAYAALSDQEAAVLTELLLSRSFDLKVAHRGPMYQYLESHRQPASGVSKLSNQLASFGIGVPISASVDDAAYNAISQGVIGVPAGPQIVTVTVTFSDPNVARGTAEAVVEQFQDDTLQDQRNQVQAAVDFYTQQVSDAQAQVTTADNSVAVYLSTHPDQRQANPIPDPTLSLLQQTDSLMRQRYATLAQQLDAEKLSLAQLNAPGSASFRIIDQANEPTQPITSKKALLFSLGGGFLVGLILMSLSVILLTLADQTVRRTEEVDHLLGLRVVGAVPRVGKKAA